ncbi:putative Lipoprotein [Pseudomonas caricapapayae]|uniref:Putative Lipoprotein n=2 Tax=Pseudomonas caricapapayae TaxID=46678 RepID=A0A0P9K799_9PSED|nr:putative Lipoprotein [Pseudomonas caricapapayae]RMM09748.1 putative Lipoprotein [Pseudomonas caricapapayae]RMV79568.1 putative Lipoprotein [Pseudomonas caricapapayae]RMV92460.1 putative Lipoprotein [Pseudomonas caricapapayae]
MLTEEAMTKTFYAALLSCSLLVLAGCDQIESSTKQVVNAAADTARQAIDETHQAATKALDQARQELSVQEPPPSSAETENTSDKEI